MGISDEPYRHFIVESYYPPSTAGLHGPIHIRPIAGQGVPTDIHVRCSKSLSSDYKVGTRFRIRAKLTDKEGSKPFLHSHHNWTYEVLE
jgi:hypothetical protein